LFGQRAARRRPLLLLAAGYLVVQAFADAVHRKIQGG
jgi:hypothetical protein